MKNAYRVILIGLAALGVVYASKGPEKMTKDIKYDPVEIGTFPVFMEVGHYIQLKDANKIQIKLEQVKCTSGRGFPCYEGCVTIKIRANYPAIISASLNKSGVDVDMLKEMNLYWENGVNTIQGSTGGWEELKLCLEAWDVEIWKSGGTAGTVKVGEFTINVKPKDTQ
ncbi:MAG: hypothetical protein ACETWQ_12665 [Phycisphaerae bacterium]